MQLSNKISTKNNQISPEANNQSATTLNSLPDKNLLRRAIENSQFRSPEVILQLQRSYGNKAVQHLLNPVTSVRNSKPLIQRWIDPTIVSEKNAISDLSNVWKTTLLPALKTIQTRLTLKSTGKTTPPEIQEEGHIKEAVLHLAGLNNNVKALVAPTANNVPAAKEALNELLLGLNSLERTLDERDDENKNNDTFTTMKFGTEFTFTNETLSTLEIENLGSSAGLEAISLIGTWKAEVEKLRPKPEISTPAGKKAGDNAVQFTYRVGDDSLDEWWWALDVDDGCLETQTKPMTQQQTQISTITNIINNHIFKVATEKLGLQTHDLVGGGHLSIDRGSTVGNSVRAVRNYLVNYVNEAATWARYDPDFVNAAMINELPMENRRQFITLIRDFDVSYNNPAVQTMSMATLLDRLKTQVFTFAWTTKQEGVTDHYQAINLEHMNDEDTGKQRLEMRRFKAQKNYGELVSQMQALAGLVDRSRERGLTPLNQQALLGASDNATGNAPLNTGRLKELAGRSKLKDKESDELQGLQARKNELDKIVQENLTNNS